MDAFWKERLDKTLDVLRKIGSLSEDKISEYLYKQARRFKHPTPNHEQINAYLEEHGLPTQPRP